MDRSWSARLNSLRVFWYRRIVNFDQQTQADTMKAVKNATDNSGRWLRAAIAATAQRIKSWLARPWDGTRLAKAAAALAVLAGVAWMFATGRWRIAPMGRGRRIDPVRREAGRWLLQVEGPPDLVADLQRLRYGASPTWPPPSDVFRRARRIPPSSRRRASRASRSIS